MATMAGLLCTRLSRSLMWLFFVFRCDVTRKIDSNGYLVYCPCMGRFGNQAEHFLGVLSFAHGLNRTLILPPWVEYRQGSAKSLQVAFDTYFLVEPLQEYHRVITMKDFMDDLAPSVWPPGQRIVLCYMARENTNDCPAKEGNPFGPFWDTFNIDFDRSEFYEPLHYDIQRHDMVRQWKERYPPENYPVLAFMGAPASFPVQAENRALHQYLLWSNTITQQADSFIRNVLPVGPFVGLHLRNGPDWIRACEHVNQTASLFAAPQCLGYQNEYGRANMELCFPSKQTILKQVKRIAKDIKAKSVFVASDHDHMLEEITHAFKKMKNPIRAYRLEPSNPHVDLAILGKSNHFIGNCISTFSSFAKRERDVAGFPSSFWAFPIQDKTNVHEEL